MDWYYEGLSDYAQNFRILVFLSKKIYYLKNHIVFSIQVILIISIVLDVLTFLQSS